MSGSTHMVSVCMLLCVACAARQGPPSTPTVYREIRVAEADLERSAARLRTEPGGPSRRALAESVCEAAGQVCTLADSVAEVDARTRCDTARRRCAEARATVAGSGEGAP